MSDSERGAYTPPTDAPLSFDARQPVRGTRPVPYTLIISALVLIALVAAIFVFYRSGVREAGQPPQTVGEPLGGMRGPAPTEAQPQDPAAGLQIYRSEPGQPPEAVQPPKFTAPPETPQPRPAPMTAAPLPPAPRAAPTTPVVVAPAALPPAKAAPVAATPKAPPPAPKVAAVTPPPAKATPAAAPKSAGGSAAVQIGAFSSQALADKGWSDAAAIAPGQAAGKGKQVQQIDKDGATLFRTAVTGFASREEAAAFCGKLKAAGKNCFVR